MEAAAVLLVILALAAVGAVAFRRGNRRLEAWLSAHWGGGARRSELEPEEMEDIASYWRCRSNVSPAPDSVDDITWNDLDMDAVFARLNGTESSVGEEILYAQLRDTGVSSETLETRGRYVRAFEAHPQSLLKTRAALHKLGRSRANGTSAYLFTPESKRPSHGAAYVLLAVLPVIILLLGFVRPAFFFGLIAVFALNAGVYYLTQRKWQTEVWGVRRLAAVLRTAERLKDALPPEMSETADQLRALCAEMRPVSRWNALFAMQKQSELDFLTDYLRLLFQLDMLCLLRLTAFFCVHSEALGRLYRLVGEMDACVALAAFRASGVETCVPKFSGEVCVEAAGLAHPLLERPVRNDIRWDRGALVTGSNASGKSTFTKALAINAILAQSVCLCTARRFSMPRARVMTSMALRDHLLEGESYFIVEIKSLRRIVSALGGAKPLLCFIDEILRGTNTVERIAASCALLRHLNQDGCLCMAATHDQELTVMLEDYRQLHFREELTPGGMTFSYQLHKGPSGTQNAIALLEQMRFPESMTSEARALARRFDKTHAWL